MENQSFITKIISNIQGKINQIALYRLTNNLDFDAETALFDMQTYGYTDLGEYARAKLF